MTRSILTSSVAACICLGLATPALAAGPAATANPPAANGKPPPLKPAEKCLTDLRAFDSQMQKDGYWLSGSGYGYGYPMMGGYGLGYGYPMRAAWQRPRPAIATYGRATMSEPSSPPPTFSPERPATGVRGRACDDPEHLQTLCGRSEKRKNANSRRAGLAAAASRSRNAGHRQGYLVPVRSVDRHRGAQSPKRGSRQRRRHRDEPADREDRLSGRSPAAGFLGSMKITCRFPGRISR